VASEPSLSPIADVPVSQPVLIELPELARLRALVRERDLRLPALVFALHWCLITLVGALATRYAVTLPEVRTAGYRLPPLRGWEHLLIQPFRNWDGFWYGLIAEQGYGYNRSATAFWPLFPWTMSVVSQVTQLPVEFAGLLLSNVAFYLALRLLYRLVRLETDEQTARRTLWLVAFFPTAFFFSAVYTESFFLLFSVAAFWWARTERWERAGAAGVLAALTRNAGGLLALPLAMLALHHYGRDVRRWPRRAWAAVLPPLGSLVYLVYLWVVWNDPLLTFQIQSNWGRSPAPPWRAFTMAWQMERFDWLRELAGSPTWTTVTSFSLRWNFAEHQVLDVAATLLVIPLLIVCFRRLPSAWGAWCAIVVAIPLFGPSTVHPLMSMPRYMLTLFPLFVALAMLTRRRFVFAGTMVVSIALLCALTVQFVTWFWVA
jgi:hypothetical protein